MPDLSAVLSGPLAEAPLAERVPDDRVARLRAAGVPIGRVNRRHEVLADPQVRHNGAVVELDHGDVGRVRLARMAARFPGLDLPPLRPAPRLGEHNRQVLAGLGFDEARVGRVPGPAAAPEES